MVERVSDGREGADARQEPHRWVVQKRDNVRTRAEANPDGCYPPLSHHLVRNSCRLKTSHAYVRREEQLRFGYAARELHVNPKLDQSPVAND